jgi:hypothetical protein
MTFLNVRYQFRGRVHRMDRVDVGFDFMSGARQGARRLLDADLDEIRCVRDRDRSVEARGLICWRARQWL